MQTVRSLATAAPRSPSRPPSVRRVAARTVPAAAVACVAVAGGATAALDLDRDFHGLSPVTVAVTAATALTAGAFLLAGLLRWARDGAKTFRAVTTGVALVSLIGPLTVLGSEPRDGPARSRPATALVLMSLHVLCAGAALHMANQLEQGSSD
jgi:hypothetical protein